MIKLFKKKDKNYSVPSKGGWTLKEAFTGAWQRNIEYKRETCLQNPTVFACISLIASDISKLHLNLVREDSNKIWNKIPFGDYSVLKNPNNYQNRIQFTQSWINSILIRGNAYILIERARSGIISKLHVLNPDLVLPLVTPSGDIFYQLGADNLSGVIDGGRVVPASEIIHDRINCFYHPLVGLSPLYAACLQAGMTIDAIKNSANHFKNNSRPSGILTAPGAISDETAARLKAHWDASYGGDNFGKTAVLGDDLKYQPVAMSAVESQMVEQLKWNDEKIASVFHVPFYMVGGQSPSYNNVEALWQQYYSQCLQIYIESMEECIDRSFNFADDIGVEFDLSGLLRMDSKSQMDSLGVGVQRGIITPNEARLDLNKKPVSGGDSPYLQQQNFSLDALAKRDAQADPFGTAEKEKQHEPIQEEKNIDINGLFVKMIQKREAINYEF